VCVGRRRVKHTSRNPQIFYKMGTKRKVNSTAKNKLHDAHRYFREILSSTGTTRKNLVKAAPLGVIKHICNLCNVACKRNTVKYTDQELKRIKPYIGNLRCLVSRKKSLTNKRKVLQKGGFLPILATVLAPIVTGLIGSFINRRSE
jgi:hypothetical protein